MSYRVDEIDRRILYHVVQEARNTDTSAIAEEVEVTPTTIRNRIHKLEKHDIITGYHAEINYERIDDRITCQFSCTAPLSERDRLVQEALDISGVVKVRQLMSSHTNLIIKAIAIDTDDISRIATGLSNLGLEIDDENVIEEEYSQPYHPFGPEDAPTDSTLTDFMRLTDGAEVVECTVSEEAAVAGLIIDEVVSEGFLNDEILVVSIERADELLIPKGNTVVQPGDHITLFSRQSIDENTVEMFQSQK